MLFVGEAAPTKVVGFGILHSRLPDLASRAWLRFGRHNGVASLAAMRLQIADERPLSRREDPLIANLIVTTPVLFPKGWPLEIKEREIQAIIGQSMGVNEIAAYVTALRLSASRMTALAEHPNRELAEGASRRSFQQDLIDLAEANTWSAYGRRCAVTDWRVDCALEVVFIQSPDQGGALDATNALLLKKDLAALHTNDLIAFNEDGKLIMSSALASMDARVYAELGKRRLRRALLSHQRLDPDCLRWRLAKFHRKQAAPEWG